MPTNANGRSAIVIAGVPAVNRTLYHRLRFMTGDPAAYVELHGNGRPRSEVIIRDIELDRARKAIEADAVASPKDFSPKGGLSGDRETATAQATAELLRRAGVSKAVVDRTLPMSFAHEIKLLGIALEYDPELGVAERRAKDEEEVAWLREAQKVTEQTVEWACRLIARAKAGKDGVLVHDGAPLTSERVMSMIDVHLLGQGYSNEVSIVAAGKEGGDCHNRGTGPIRTSETVIIDIFPRNKRTLYNGDCTRVVVHGEVPPVVAKMHKAVVDAKASAIAATRAGVTGADVHAATMGVLREYGYERGLPSESSPKEYCSIQHGTGHGVGLEVHEPPLLDDGVDTKLIVGDCLTIEPGLYAPSLGGIRVEDMVIVREGGCENLNSISEGLDWS